MKKQDPKETKKVKETKKEVKETKETKKTNKYIMPIIIVVLIAIIGVIIALNLKDTYSAGSVTVQFWAASGDRNFINCKTDANGKLTNDCYQVIKTVCSKWSYLNYTQGGCHCIKNQCEDPNKTCCNHTYKICQSPYYETAEIYQQTFKSNTTLYCKFYTGSIHPGYTDIGCYQCKNDTNIKKWGTVASLNNLSGEKCTGGWQLVSGTLVSSNGNQNISKLQDKCVTSKYCYVCKANSNVMKWSTNGNGDSACSGGYNKDTGKTEAQCKTITPTPTPTPAPACYVCKADNKIMKWGTDGNGDTACSGGYNKDTTITQANCKSVVPTPTPAPACYICKGNENIVKWDTVGGTDNKCTGGYNKTTISKENCVVNPKTGTSGIAIAWFAAIFAMTFAYYYFKQTLAEEK